MWYIMLCDVHVTCMRGTYPGATVYPTNAINNARMREARIQPYLSNGHSLKADTYRPCRSDLEGSDAGWHDKKIC